ncbi:hypothetical protein L873DRAFT_1684282 [Choiromyces venosus 120613-1]|uniref:Cleavage/polyadenylation specificity factor A subunit C-terminal domain-containing protein n=1 Tax=Choiromyces venosus 120613-1 TaxID=1336337 RepID=A0A3N4JQN2_9PEZI|nr:hypothetical protein L873DRAFT_1684282 [Choiromyces venosus 120613-1]
MPEVYTELTAPTSVSFSLKLPFTSATSENVLVAKTSLLQIFTTTTYETELNSASVDAKQPGDVDRRILDADEEQTFAADIALQRSQVESVTKLVLVAEYPLSGSVTGLQKIKLLSTRSGGEAVLASFKDAKCSLMEWDPETNSITTISLHYYEREEFCSPVVSDGLPTELVADPGSRCAALRFAGDMLAIMPFRQREDEELSLGRGDSDEIMGDDGDNDDWDPEMADTARGEDTIMGEGNIKTTEAAEGKDRPYHPSFVLSVSQLDDAISHVISLTFLHEYREPTFGILYSPRRTWTGLLAAEGRKDTISYIVITLDLEQKASTPILSVSGLPYDIFKVVPLAPPIGGSLLIGENELIHVDQAGKTTGVAVNPFCRRSTGFAGLADQSDLCLELEGSQAVELEGEEGDMLLLTKRGEGVIVGFKMDGRNVSGVKITKLTNHPGSIVGGRASTAIGLGGRRLFIGCIEGDARVLKWRRKGEKKKVGEGIKEEVLENEDEDDVYGALEDMDDDLYGGGGDSSFRKDSLTNGRRNSEAKPQGEYIFQTHDRLTNLGPFRDITLGKPTFPEESRERQKGVSPELELVTTSGPSNTPEDSGISIIRKSISPTIVGRFDFPQCQALWTVRARSAKTSNAAVGLGGEEDDRSVEETFDRFLFVTKSDESQVFRVGDTFEEVRGTDFESEGETIEVGVVGNGMRIVQVVSEQVRVYDCDLQLSQIIPMFDEETGEEGPNVHRARVCDPYVLLIKVDGSAAVYKVDSANLELFNKYQSGCIYASTKGTFIPLDAPVENAKDYLLFLLTIEGGLQIYDLSNFVTPLFVAAGFSTLYPLLRADNSTSSTANREKHQSNQSLIEILVADLGDSVFKEPYLIARSSNNDLTFYKPFIASSPSTLRFIKSPNPHLASHELDLGAGTKKMFRPLTAVDNIAGYSAVFLSGADPNFVIKTAKSNPRIHKLAGSGVRSLSSFHSAGADRGFVYVDSLGIVRVALMPAEFTFDGSWGYKKVILGEHVQSLAYFPPMNVYAISTSKRQPFDLAEEDGNVTKDDTTLQPEIDSGTLKLLSPQTWTAVDEYKFAHNEIALVVKTISLEVSEHTKERKQLVSVGTAIFRGEDHSARGGIYVFEVIEVVPEPNRPETNRKLKLVTREEVKGTVSAICGVNGYLLAAQGQKIMVRGLKEDQSLLPVAFLDMCLYVSVAKNLDGMILFGDFMKSVWFAGFSEEPYKMTLFGKDTQKLEVISAEFLPDGNQLYFVVADAESNIHILQYDPERTYTISLHFSLKLTHTTTDPKSLAGQRLIRRADFFSGHEISTLTMLPLSPSASASSDSYLHPDAMDISSSHNHHHQNQQQQQEYFVLAGTQTGSLAMIRTIPETAYRRLNIVQGQIVNGEEHVAGLNPREYRAVVNYSGGGDTMRGVLDGVLVSQWIGLAEGRKGEVSAKAGCGAQGIREDLKRVVELEVGYL